MEIKDLDEVEHLTYQYRKVMEAKKSIEAINNGGISTPFVLTDKSTLLKIDLFDMQKEVLEAINGVLNDRYDRVVAKLREF